LFAQHGKERGQEGYHKARVHETSGGDDLARRIFLNERNCGGLTGDGGLVESEDGTEEGGIRVRLEVRIGINCKSGDDDREQTSLQEQVR